MTRKIVITSGKGGVGKTTVTANVGYCLSKLGFRVCLCDLDFGLNNLDVVTSVENLIVFDLIDVIENRCRAKQALIQSPIAENLFVLPCNHSLAKSTVGAQNVKAVLEGLSVGFDYILIDCPAGIDVGFHRAVASADEAILVTTPNISSLRDADKVLTILKSYKLSSVKVVVNRMRGDLTAVGSAFSGEEIESALKTEIIGIIPEDDVLFQGINENQKINSGKAFKLLANNVVKKENRLYDYSSKYSGVLGSLRRELKKLL